jgi:peptide/nickel transport system permease protein
MLSLILGRIGTGLLTLWIVSVLIFASTEILPGDVAAAILGQERTPEAMEAIRGSLGLDRPAYVRYAEWLGGFLRGDLGKSLESRRDIGGEIKSRLRNSLFLAGVAAAVSIPLSLWLGLLSVIRRNGAVDRLINATALIAISTPEFFVAYILILLLAVKIHVFPSLSIVTDDMPLLSRLYAVALPATTLVLVVLAYMMRLTQAAVTNELSNTYVEMAILKGLLWRRVVLVHALPNAIAPIATVIALNLAYLLVGVVVVEVVFVYPGMGQLLVDSVAKHDVPVVQACGLIFACAYVSLNMIADLCGILANPRLRYPR